MGKHARTSYRIKTNAIQKFRSIVNITLTSQRDQMASSRKKFSYLAIVAGAVMLVMTFVTPPAFAAEGGDSGLI